MEQTNQGGRAGNRGLRMGLVASHVVIGVVAFTIGRSTRQPEPVEVATVAVEGSGTSRVTGIGGVFFKSADPAALLDWYRTHLGIDSYDWGGFAFQWQESGMPSETGYTIWTPFPGTTDYWRQMGIVKLLGSPRSPQAPSLLNAEEEGEVLGYVARDLPVTRFLGLLWSVFWCHSRSACLGSIFPSTVEIRPAFTARCTTPPAMTSRSSASPLSTPERSSVASSSAVRSNRW